MIDTDRQLKEALEEMADEVRPPVLTRRAIGRAQRRRSGMAALAGAGVVLLVAAGLWASSLDLGASGTGRLDGGPARPAPRQEDPGPPPAEMKGELVASGVVGDTSWWVGAFIEEDGDLCTETYAGEDGVMHTGGHGCGPFDPDRHPVGLSIDYGDQEPWIATGDVPDITEKVVARLPGGDEQEVPLYPAPEALGLPAKFYVIIPLFPETESISAYDGDGNLIGTQKVAPIEWPNTDIRLTPNLLIDEGTIAGEPWVLKARLESINGDETACTELFLGFNEEHGGGGGCHINVARGDTFGFSESTFEKRPDLAAIYGTVDRKVAQIRIDTTEAGSLTLEPFTPEAEELSDHRFFVGFLEFVPDEERIGGTISALDEEGNVLQTMDLCAENAFGIERGSTCGP